MEPLPKIARERLQAGKVPAHPDADLLTAFAENTITQRERSQVAEHLSRCVECRQVLAVTVDLSRAAGVSMPASSSVHDRRLLSWPVLRWGALSACVVIVSAAGLLLNRRSLEGPKEVAGTRATEKQEVAMATRSRDKVETPAAPEKASAPQAKLPQSRAEADSRETELPARVEGHKQFLKLSDEAASKKEAGLLALVPGVEEKTVAEKPMQAAAAVGSGRGDKSPAAPAGTAAGAVATTTASPAVDNKVSSGSAAKNEQQQQPLPTTSETVEVTAAAPTLQTENASVMANSSQSKPKTGPSASRAALSATAKDQLAATAATASGNRLMLDVNAAQWTLSADGVPQRSFNAGKTWEAVRVDGHTGFRALSAHGMDIWVGGLGGILYHSSDLGMHWTRVIPVANQDTLSADILTIDFRDDQHGKLTTTNRETWTTSDAGKIWQKE